jgi:hypothetical protein
MGRNTSAGWWKWMLETVVLIYLPKDPDEDMQPSIKSYDMLALCKMSKDEF